MASVGMAQVSIILLLEIYVIYQSPGDLCCDLSQNRPVGI